MYLNTKLTNGIRVVAEKLPYIRSVTVGVWVKAGSANENMQENGISHFIEHMFFKGTESRSAKRIAEDIDSLGAQINAFTSKEYTCYYVKTMDEKMSESVNILADIVCNSKFDEEEMAREKGVVIEEISMSIDTPDDLVHEVLCQNFFGTSPVAKTILGPADNIRRFTRDDIMAYLKKRYSPENMVIAVAGNFEEAELLELLEECFGGIKGLSSAGECETEGEEKRIQIITKDIEQVHISIGYPAYNYFNPKKYAVSVLNNALGGSMSSRLFQSIRESAGMAYSVYSYTSVYSNDGMISMYAGTSKDKAERVIKTMLQEVDELLKNGITNEEFIKSKQQLRGGFVLGMENSSSRMNAIGRSMIMENKVHPDDEVLSELDAVTMEDVKEATEYMFGSQKRSMAIVGNISDEEAIKNCFN